MISVEEKNNIVEVSVVGQLEYEKAEELLSIIKNKVVNIEAERVNLDFSRINYVNSIGIGTVVTIFKLLREKGKKLVILRPQPNVMRVLKLTKINEVIEIEGEPK